jgi:hypothetical protein
LKANSIHPWKGSVTLYIVGSCFSSASSQRRRCSLARQTHMYWLMRVAFIPMRLNGSTLQIDKICTVSCTYIHVLSLCHLYPLLVT